MINNRQNGRRRGRGGIRPQNGAGGGADRGNRIDNRARGNANQLHEKYKTLARDAQMQGDRVMTEYYLQFADHYFRVLSEARARFDEQQPRRERFDAPEYEEEENEGEGNGAGERADARSGDNRRPSYQGERGQDAFGDGREPRQERDFRQEREPRFERAPREDRAFREDRTPREDRAPREARAPREESGARDELPFPESQPPVERSRREPRANRAEPAAAQPAEESAPVQEERRPRGRPRRTAAKAAEQIEIDRLPPALSPEPAANDADAAPEEAPAPKPRRTRRARAEAPAAE